MVRPNCTRTASASAGCVRFSCCSLIASTLTAAPWLCPLQLLLLEYVCLLSHTHSTKYKPKHTLQIWSLWMLLHIIFVYWVGILSSNKRPFAITCSKIGVGVFLRDYDVLYLKNQPGLQSFKSSPGSHFQLVSCTLYASQVQRELEPEGTMRWVLRTV